MAEKETEAIKRVRMLLRVSSDQQLEADGDLSRMKIGALTGRNTLREVSVVTKILFRKGMLYRKLIKMPKTKSMIY